jgi:DNA-binding IclR family transcriptional regulator
VITRPRLEAGATLKTVERALGVLEIVASSPRPSSVRKVARELGHNLSSTYNLVNTLIGTGYLIKESSGGLRLGPKIGPLIAAYSRGTNFAQMLIPFAERLAESSGETVYITRRVGDQVVIQAVFESAQSLRVSGLAVGSSGSEDRRASGKAVLAFLPDDEREAILRAAFGRLNDAERSVRRARVVADLATVRRDGYALDEEDFEPGVCCIAAPFFDATGTVVGSLTVSAPVVRLGLVKGPIRDQVLAVANEISDLLRAPVATDQGSA